MRRGVRAVATALALTAAVASFLSAGVAKADAPATAGDDAADTDLQQCKNATNGTDNQAIIALCTKALTHGAFPDSVMAPLYLNRGTAYLAVQDYDNAVADLSRAIELRPGAALPYALRGRAHIGLGETVAAIGDLVEAIKIAPDHGDYYDALGDAYAGAGENEAAVAAYVQSIRLRLCDGESFESCGHLRDGVAAYLEGKDALALSELGQAQTRVGSHARLALLWLALARQRSRLDGTTLLNDATAADDDWSWPGALIRYYQGRISSDELRSEAFYTSIVFDGPLGQACDLDFYVAARALVDGRAQAAAQGFDAALKACAPTSLEYAAAKAERVLASTPISAQMAQQMSACAAANDAGGDPQGIVEFCDDALQNPDMPDAWQFNALIIRAAARHSLGDDANAAADLDRALVLRPGSPDAYRRRGIYRLALGDADGGLADLDQAIKLNPELLEARLNRGWALADRGDWNEARAAFTHAVGVDVRNPRVYLARGAVAFLAGEDAHAIQNFRLAIEHAPHGAPYAVIWLALAIHRSHGDDGGALAAGTTALDLGQWPGPVLKYLDGTMSASELADAAANPAQVCEAAFYTGLAMMLDDRAYEARDALGEAHTLCADGSVESAAATILLRKM